MKKLLIAVLLAGLTIGASAQKFGYRGGRHYAPRPRVSVGIGVPLYSPYYGLGYGWGYPYGYPPYGSGWGYSVRPSKLSLEIADIQNDYQARIWAARHDETLSRQERKKEVRQLKADREREIIEAKRRYYRY
jgi:hypothetical protein